MTKKTVDSHAWLANKTRNMEFCCGADLDLVSEEGKTPTFEMLAYGGGLMRPNGFPHDVVMELKSAMITRQVIPILRDHDQKQVVGHGVANIDSRGVHASGHISGTGEAAAEVTELAKNGFPWQASIGSRSNLIFVERGENVTVNGQSFDGPVFVARDTKIHEISFVAVGGDQSTEVAVAASMDSEDSEMPKEQADQSVEMKAQLETLRADAEAAKKASDVSNKELIDLKATLDEERRVSSIKTFAAHYESTEEEIKAAMDDKDLCAQAAELRFIKAAHGRVLESRPESGGAPAAHIKDQSLEASAMSVAFARTMNVPAKGHNKESGTDFGIEASYDDKVLEESDQKKYRGMTLHALMDNVLMLAGKRFSGSRKSDDFIKEFLSADRELKASGFSTMAASNILEDAANKALLSAYMAQEVIWSNLASIKNLGDFKTHNFYRLTVDGGNGEVGNAGELKHGEFMDDKYTLQAATYGMMLALTRQDMINDDMNAFSIIPASLGRLAALAIEYAVLELILANAGAFYSVGNGNLLTGAGSALDISGLTAAALAFRNQVDAKGRPILVSPDRILVGAQHAVTASQLHNQTDVREGRGSSENSEQFTSNPHVGAFRPVVTPILNNANIVKMDGTAFSNQDLDKWYMFGPPDVIASYHIGFLGGNQTPVIESAESDFNTLGMQWRSYHDWGVGQADPKGSVQNDGA